MTSIIVTAQPISQPVTARPKIVMALPRLDRGIIRATYRGTMPTEAAPTQMAGQGAQFQ
jgi:hypothetical protein